MHISVVYSNRGIFKVARPSRSGHYTMKWLIPAWKSRTFRTGAWLLFAVRDLDRLGAPNRKSFIA